MRKLKFLLATTAILTLASGMFFSANATAVAPNSDGTERVSPWKDATCDSDTFKSFKIDPPANAVFGPIKIKNLDGDSFDWKLTDAGKEKYDVTAVIVKGGPYASIVYFYNQDTDDWDTNLQADWNDNSGKPYGVSHITFCFDKKA